MAESLAIKYRPKEWDEVCGQNSTIRILQNQLESNDIKQAYLFKGASGCGKTTCARIFGNKANENKGKLIELNAADTNGVDDIINIIDDCRLKPIDSKYKVYIIDEVHMLSKGAFNALLKILEEPPKHVIFILCTTDPQKIPKTVLSRLQKFEFTRMSNQNVVKRLSYIIDSENEEMVMAECGSRDAVADIEWARQEGIDVIDYDNLSLEYIARVAEGGMREAITLLDTILSFTRDITIQSITKCLGDTQYKHLNDILEGILDQDIPKCIKALDFLHSDGRDLRLVVKDLARYTLDICKYYYTKDFDITVIPPDFYDIVEEIIDTTDVSFLLDVVEALNKLDNRIRFDTNPKYVVESEIIILCK